MSIATHPSVSAASLLLPVLLSSDTHREGLGLLRTLVQAGLVSLDDPIMEPDEGQPVGRTRRQSQAVGKTLRTAILEGGAPGGMNHLASFYSEHSARELLALDPDFFKNQIQTVWKHLVEWRAHEDHDRAGFVTNTYGNRSAPAPADAWTAAVVTSLQPLSPTPENLEVFGTLLAMGMNHSAMAMAGADLAWWLAVDAKGVPVVRQAASSHIWTHLTTRLGVDPWQNVGPDKPLWSALLPKNSAAIPNAHTFRSAIEDWITDQLAAGAEDPRLFEHRRKHAIAVFGSPMWSKMETRDQAVFLAKLPPQWPSWSVMDQPVWLRGLQQKDRARPWAKLLSSNKSWRENTPPLARLVMWLLEQPKSVLDQPRSVPAGVATIEAVDRDAVRPLLSPLATHYTVSKELVATWFAAVGAWSENLSLEKLTPPAPSRTRSGPRL